VIAAWRAFGWIVKGRASPAAGEPERQEASLRLPPASMPARGARVSSEYSLWSLRWSHTPTTIDLYRSPNGRYRDILQARKWVGIDLNAYPTW